MEQVDKDFKLMKNEIYDYMSTTRGNKYKFFLRALRSFKYLSLSPTKGTFLESYYVLMRYIDDIVDGDAPLPEGFSNSEEFVSQKIKVANNQKAPEDKVDHLMMYCFEIGKKFGQDFSLETHDILSSMLFDARRYGDRQLFSEEELQQHFHLLDIRGTISATLKIFGENPSKYPILEPLGFATRIYYNLRDYDDDIRAGLVNVSAQDYDKFKIIDLEDRLSPPVQNWMKDQAQQGLGLIGEHRRNLLQANFGILAKLTFPLVYEIPSKNYFEQILQQV